MQLTWDGVIQIKREIGKEKNKEPLTLGKCWILAKCYMKTLFLMSTIIAEFRIETVIPQTSL